MNKKVILFFLCMESRFFIDLYIQLGFGDSVVVVVVDVLPKCVRNL